MFLLRIRLAGANTVSAKNDRYFCDEKRQNTDNTSCYFLKTSKKSRRIKTDLFKICLKILKSILTIRQSSISHKKVTLVNLLYLLLKSPFLEIHCTNFLFKGKRKRAGNGPSRAPGSKQAKCLKFLGSQNTTLVGYTSNTETHCFEKR